MTSIDSKYVLYRLKVLLEIISLIILVAIRMGWLTSIARSEIAIKHFKNDKTLRKFEIWAFQKSNILYSASCARNALHIRAEMFLIRSLMKLMKGGLYEKLSKFQK